MKNKKLEAMKAVFANHNIVIDDAIIVEAIKAASTKSETGYEQGDFVAFYEGMGEMGHGEVKTVEADRYRIIPYFGGVPEGYERSVGAGDMRGLSTIEKSLEYERIRGGG